MTFLSANYGLSPDQIARFYRGYCNANAHMGQEIEMSWHEGHWSPDDPECAMIECLVDADRLEPYIEDYMDWCFGFLMKQELAHDLLEVPMPLHCINYLKSKGLTCWQFV